jgi:hypothetical protein
MGLISCALVMLIQPMRVLLVDLGQSPHRANFPFEQVSMEIRGRGFDRGLILTEDKFIGGNLKLFLQDSTLITPSIPLQKYRPHKNVLVVWQTVNPVGFLDEMNLEPASEVVTKKLPFRHSKKFFYDVSFQLYTAHDF